MADELKAYTPTARERFAQVLGAEKDAPRQFLLDASPLGWLTTVYDAARGTATHLPGMAKELFGSSESPFDKELTREQFFGKYRKPTKSKDEYIKTELDAARSSDAYGLAGPREKERILKRAETAANKQYDGYVESANAAESRLESDWEAYKGDIKAKKDELANTPFRRRFPSTAAALPGLGLAAALGVPWVGRAVAQRIRSTPTRRWQETFKEADDVARSGQGVRTPEEMTLAAERLSDLTPRLAAFKKDYGAGAGAGSIALDPTLKQSAMAGGTAALTGAGLAAEGALFPDQWDAINLPPGPAQDKAKQRALDLQAYGERGLMGALSGFSGYKMPIWRTTAPVQQTEGMIAKYGTTPESAVTGLYASREASARAAGASAAQPSPLGPGGLAAPGGQAGAGQAVDPRGAFGGAQGQAAGQQPLGAGAANQAAQAGPQLPPRRGPSPDQYSASRDAINAEIRAGIAADNLSPTRVRRQIEAAGGTPPSDPVIRRQIREVRAIAAETGATGGNLVRSINARMRRGDIKNALPFAAAPLGFDLGMGGEELPQLY